MRISSMLDKSVQGALQKMSQAVLPLSTAMKIKKNMKKISEAVETYEEQRQKLLAVYGEKDKKGELKKSEDGQVKFSDKNLEEFGKEMSQLLNTDVELVKINVADLGDKVEMSAIELFMLSELLED